MNAFTRILSGLMVVLSVQTSAQQPLRQTVIRPAADGVFEAFKSHPLVGLGDDHGLVEGMNFYVELVRDPRFAREVGNVVVEMGAARHQDIMDRYVAGETVPYTELRKVWTDTVGAVPDGGNIGFAKFFATVRKINKALAPARRIRVWLGEPPLDWSAEKPEWRNAMRLRDSHPAELILKNILAKGKKALVIYGAFHFTLEKDPDGGGTLYGRVEEKYPNTFFRVVPYSWSHRPPACESLLKQAEKDGPLPALAVFARGGPANPLSRECATFPFQLPSAPGQNATPTADAGNPGEPFDAVLFFGPIETLTGVGGLPEYGLDTEYRLEVGRRARATGFPLLRWPKGFSLKKSDYDFDLDAPGYAERLAAMFARHDRNGDGVVTEDEYEDPIPLPQLALSAEAFARLAGTWNGTEGTSSISLIIEKDAKGRYLGHYINDPYRIAVPVAEAQFKDGKLVAKLDTSEPVASVLTLDLSGSTLSGTIARPQMPDPIRVTLTRK